MNTVAPCLLLFVLSTVFNLYLKSVCDKCILGIEESEWVKIQDH